MKIKEKLYSDFTEGETIFISKQDFVISVFINSEEETEYNIYSKNDISPDSDFLDSEVLSETIDDFEAIDGGTVYGILSKENLEEFIDDLDLSAYAHHLEL